MFDVFAALGLVGAVAFGCAYLALLGVLWLDTVIERHFHE